MEDKTIDIVIPCIESDKPMLKLAIEGLRKNLVQPLGTIYLVVPDRKQFKDFKGKDIKIVNETDVVGFPSQTLRNKFGKRTGWFYQQLIKLSADNLATSDNFLVYDADHVLLKPHSFLENDKPVYYTSAEHHLPYFAAIGVLFNGTVKKVIKPSFISDKMLFNKDILKALKTDIESLHEGSWIHTVINAYQHPNASGFSEFETYGTYVSNRYPDSFTLKPDGRLMSFTKIEGKTLDQLTELWSDYASITQHKTAV